MDSPSSLRRRGAGGTAAAAATAAARGGACAGGAGACAAGPPAPAEVQGRLAEFQRNAAFVGFAGVVVVSALSLLVEELRTVLIPLIWATFFALPLERTVSRLNGLLIEVFSRLLDLCRSGGPPQRSVAFHRPRGRNCFIIQNTAGNRGLIERLRSQSLWDGSRQILARPCRSLGCKCAVVLKCCQRRLRITQVTRVGPSSGEDRPLNCVKENWCYYVGSISGADTDELRLQLFLDQGCCDYPAIVEGPAAAGSPALAEDTGTFEVDRTSPLSWAVALLLVAGLVLGGLCGVGLLLFWAANSFMQNLDAYEQGVSELVDWLRDITRRQFSKEFWDDVRKRLQDFLRSFLATWVESFLTGFGSSLFQLVLFFIYLLFWLVQPMPVSSPVVEVFKTYLFLKSIVCMLFALLMSGMLFCLDCPLWPLFFVLTFVLNYIPEIGALIAGLVSLPAVLLNASAGTPQERLWKALYLVVLGLLFKFITGNIIEVHMYTTRGGEFMRMHSVVLMSLIMVFGQLLGITGMFLSVPMVAAIKYYLISARIPPAIVDPLLCFIEGDEQAVHRTFVDKVLTSRGDTSATPSLAALAPGGAAEVPVDPAPAPPEAMGEPLLLEMGGSMGGSMGGCTDEGRQHAGGGGRPADG